MPSQYRVVWSAPGGGTGYSVFHAQDATTSVLAQSFADNVRAFFDSFRNLVPNDVTWVFEGEVLNMTADGVLTSVQPVTAPTTVVGSGDGSFNRAAGFRFDWLTGAIVEGRRLRGRTYIVPAMAFAFTADGVLTPIVQEQLRDNAEAFLAAMDTDGIQLHVWSRTHAFSSNASDVVIPPQGAILRSRRD